MLPALFNGYVCNDLERKLFSLPAKIGGLGIFIHERCTIEYENSRLFTTDMVNKICTQSKKCDDTITRNQKRAINTIKAR